MAHYVGCTVIIVDPESVESCKIIQQLVVVFHPKLDPNPNSEEKTTTK